MLMTNGVIKNMQILQPNVAMKQGTMLYGTTTIMVFFISIIQNQKKVIVILYGD